MHACGLCESKYCSVVWSGQRSAGPVGKWYRWAVRVLGQTGWDRHGAVAPVKREGEVQKGQQEHGLRGGRVHKLGNRRKTEQGERPPGGTTTKDQLRSNQWQESRQAGPVAAGCPLRADASCHFSRMHADTNAEVPLWKAATPPVTAPARRRRRLPPPRPPPAAAAPAASAAARRVCGAAPAPQTWAQTQRGRCTQAGAAAGALDHTGHRLAPAIHSQGTRRTHSAVQPRNAQLTNPCQLWATAAACAAACMQP